MARFALGIEYDGSPYFGWQSQAGGNTVQDAVEAALTAVAAAPVRVHCAGRTDTGVHALAQVIHFDTPVDRPEEAWVRGTNAHLPATVSVLWAKAVSEEFHARFSARGRRYRYVLLNRPQRPGLHAGRVGWYHRPLDVERMALALQVLIGTHDFSAFRSAQCQAKSPIKTVSRAELSRQDDYLVFDFAADGFLHHMIRNIVGALIYIGNGKAAPESLARLLEARDRTLAPPTFSPAGLYFAGAEYDEKFNLPKVSRCDTALLP